MIIILLSNGFEEIEALTPVDMLRRAGFEVKTVGVEGRVPTGAHNIPVLADASPEDIDLSEVTMAVFPGGMPGALNLDASPFTNKVIEAAKGGKMHLAAICAAPLVLGRRGLLNGKRATCYPGFEGELLGAFVCEEDFVTDGNITTGRGMEYSLPFAKELVRVAKEMESKDSLSSDLVSPFDLAKLLEQAAASESEAAEDTVTLDEESIKPDFSSYELPPIDLLREKEEVDDEGGAMEIQQNADRIIETLSSFNVTASIKGVDRGPRITRYEVVPAKGVKVSALLNLQDDVALNLAAGAIRVEAPIPGRSAIGFEVPNRKPSAVNLRELIETEEFKSSKSKTAVCIGRDVAGEPVLGDVAKLPHLIVAGATGMGKSVCINSLVISMLYKATPDELKLIMIDPKQVEFTMYNGIPHLLVPVITDAREAAGSLMWAVEEMERRYDLLHPLCVRNVDAYNEKVAEDPSIGEHLPKIVIVIDEFADLMLQVKEPVEELVMRIAQKARAAGIYLIIGTQRPSVNVITGVIKANVPSRIAFKLTSNVDSRTVLDSAGAEKLLDRGDMLYAPAGAVKPFRVQGAFVSDLEVTKVTDFLKKQFTSDAYDREVMAKIKLAAQKCARKLPEEPSEQNGEGGYLNDRQFLDAVEVAVTSGKISTSLIQRKLSIGYGKAAKFIDIMEEMGIVGESNGQRPREVLITPDEWREKLLKDSAD